MLGVKMSGRIGTTSSSALHKNKFEGGCEECSTSSVPAKRVSTKIKLIFFPSDYAAGLATCKYP